MRPLHFDRSKWSERASRSLAETMDKQRRKLEEEKRRREAEETASPPVETEEGNEGE